MLTKNSLATDTLVFLLKIGGIYKSDLSTWIAHRTPSSRNYSSHLITRLQQRGMISIDEIIAKRDGSMPAGNFIVTLTSQGKDAVLGYLGDDYYNQQYYSWQKPFHSTIADKLNFALSTSTAVMMFDSIGIPCFTDSKPSLYYLYSTLSPNGGRAITESKDHRMSYTKEQLEALLEKGFFYTASEFRQFANQISPGKSDTYKGSRFKGIFINSKDVLVVYLSNHGENRILRMNYEMEKSLVEGITQDLGHFTQLRRVLPMFSSSKTTFNSPHALVLSEGDSLVYSMTLGNPHGLIKNKDIREVNQDRKTAIEKRKDKNSDIKYGHVFFDATSDLYERIFVISDDENGLRMLRYRCSHAIEDWYEDSVNYFKDNRRFFTPSADPYYPYCELVSNYKIPAIFMPVYEVKLMDQMSKFDYSPTILTYRDMAETIAHCNRKSSRYYDASYITDEGKSIAALYLGDDFTNIYDETGYIKGQKMIMDYLKCHNLKCDDIYTQFFHLHQYFDYEDATSFYNDIYRGIISVEDASGKLNNVQQLDSNITISKRKRKPARKSITITLTQEMVKRYKKAADRYDMSVQQYVIRNMHDIVMKDSQEKQDDLTKKRAQWRKF